jgi:hypothetical protein
MKCRDCVNRTDFGEERFGQFGHYAAHARCFVWGCDVQEYCCACKFHETDPAKRIEDTNAPWYKMQVNVHDFKTSWGTCQILTSFAKGDWYGGMRFDVRCAGGAYSQPSWWGGRTFATEQETINHMLDVCINYVKNYDKADTYINFLKMCKFENRQLSLF